VGVGAGLRDPSPLEAGLGVQFLPPIWFGDGDGCMEAGARTGILKPAPDPPRCHVYFALPFFLQFSFKNYQVLESYELCISRVLIASVRLSSRRTCCILGELHNSADNSLVRWPSDASGFTFYFIVLQVVILQSSANNIFYVKRLQNVSTSPYQFQAHAPHYLNSAQFHPSQNVLNIWYIYIFN